MAIPMNTLLEFDGKKGGVSEGDVWRINFSRVDWVMKIEGANYKKIQDRPEHNWVWSPQGAINMHMPEHWGYLVFTEQEVSDDKNTAYTDQDYLFKSSLVDIQLAQKKYHNLHKTYADDISDLEIDSEKVKESDITIYANKYQFFVVAKARSGHTYGIDHTGKIRILNE